jgi:hypothetical protein
MRRWVAHVANRRSRRGAVMTSLARATPVVVSGELGFQVHVQPARDAIWVQPVGELDLATIPGLRGQVEELIAVGVEHVRHPSRSTQLAQPTI